MPARARGQTAAARAAGGAQQPRRTRGGGPRARALSARQRARARTQRQQQRARTRHRLRQRCTELYTTNLFSNDIPANNYNSATDASWRGVALINVVRQAEDNNYGRISFLKISKRSFIAFN